MPNPQQIAQIMVAYTQARWLRHAKAMTYVALPRNMLEARAMAKGIEVTASEDFELIDAIVDQELPIAHLEEACRQLGIDLARISWK